jgi:hypothetical protein
MNMRCSKHVEDTKNWIKSLMKKSVHFVALRYVIVSQYTLQKHKVR